MHTHNAEIILFYNDYNNILLKYLFTVSINGREFGEGDRRNLYARSNRYEYYTIHF